MLDPEFTRRYFFGTWAESEWKPGAPYRVVAPDGNTAHGGEVVEIEPQRRLVLTWRNELRPELHAEGHSRLSYELEPQGEVVKLTIIHEIDRPESKLIQSVSGGWPLVLASLKGLLETGEGLEATRRWHAGGCKG